jgi:hypothetical protein
MENAECYYYEIMVASALLDDIGIKQSEKILKEMDTALCLQLQFE